MSSPLLGMGLHEPSPPPSPFLPRATMTSTAPIRVIVADDSPEVRQHLVAMTSEIDEVQIVDETEDVEQTIEAVRTLDPEAVVLDIQLRDGSGIQALKHIKKESPNVRVIMLTNHSNSFYRSTCMDAGADFFFDKSTEFEKVNDVLAELPSSDEQ